MAPRHYVCELFVHLCVRACVGGSIGSESVPKVIHNKNFLLNCNQHFDNYFKPFLIKLLRVFYLKNMLIFTDLKEISLTDSAINLS